MTLHANIKLGSSALGTSAEHAPAVDVSLEQRTMTPDGSLDVTVRGRGPDLGAFESGLDADGTVSRWVPVGGTDTWKLYRTRLTEAASASMDYDGWADGRAVFPSVERSERGWVVDALVPDRAVLQRFARNCESEGVKFDLLQVSESDQVGGGRQFGLTDLQAETLFEAYDRGYYTVPRETNLEEVADPLGVSHQALSERLRRGVGSLIESTIVDHWVGPDGPRDPDSDSTDDTGVTSRKAPIERSVALSL
jgi:hypothetical protein